MDESATTVEVVSAPVVVQTEVVEVPIPVPVPVVSEEKGEELTTWLSRVEQYVVNLQQATQEQMGTITEIIQSQREILSSLQTCLLRVEQSLSQLLIQNPPEPAPTNPPEPAPAAPAPEVVIVAPVTAEESAESKEPKKTTKKVRKV